MAKKERQMYHFIFNFNNSEKKEELIHNIISSISNFMKDIEYNSFYVGLSGIDNIDDKNIMRIDIMNQIESKLGKKRDFNDNEANFLIDFKKNNILLTLSQVYIAGNYCKFSRNLAQTQHFCRFCKGKGCEQCSLTGVKTSKSVEQLLGKVILEKFNASQLIMHGAGREDVDVLMLGKGRPFVVELTIPKKRFFDLKKIENEINKKYDKLISVNNLIFTNKENVVKTKNTFHDKIYGANIFSENKFDIEKINNLIDKEIVVEQLTPTRVSKRRVLMKRDKMVIFKSVKKISDKEFYLVLKTTHGTYVKEFISGDDNKTKPSISEILGTKCTCTELDVLEII